MSRYGRARVRGGNNAEGRRAVLELLRSGHPIAHLYIAQGVEPGPQIEEILRLAGNHGITVSQLTPKAMLRMSATKKTQGVIATTPERTYVLVEDIVMAVGEQHEEPLLCVLDGIQDPHNVGAIARTLEAFGGHGMVLAASRAAGITPGAIRASAGAIEHLMVARESSITKALGRLQTHGLKAVGLDSTAESSIDTLDLRGPLALVIGAEARGMSQSVTQSCNAIGRIPLRGKIASLNASVAAGIALFEIYRQRARG